ncbi:MAG TPA: hypothetical protein VEQ41_08255 [Solirubrobacterales bacterium]|nr:hypothetical protein [Solirubrobacterales bacterium]
MVAGRARWLGGRALAVALLALAAAAPPAAGKTVGSDLGALEATKTLACPASASCDVAQELSGNGTPFSPPTGVIASWSVELGPVAPSKGIRLVVQDATGTAGEGQGRRTIDLGPLWRAMPNGISTFRERLPIHADEVFGVRLVGSGGGPTRATIAAPFTGEYKTLLLWDPPLPFGHSHRLPDRVVDNARVTLSIEVVPPDPGRCAPLNRYTGSRLGDEYGGFHDAGDLIFGLRGNDRLRGNSGDDCIHGGRGADRLAGMDGADLITAGGGRDDVGAGGGPDLVFVRDGSRDTVRCGAGHDIVKADSIDRLGGCEQIRPG